MNTHIQDILNLARQFKSQLFCVLATGHCYPVEKIENEHMQFTWMMSKAEQGYHIIIDSDDFVSYLLCLSDDQAGSVKRRLMQI
ncbi:MAG TPA: hypothetical protein VGN64_17710 [Dyadobacter sp.]|nr:hypothetical protein [Dyadobacter sp.]